MREKVDKRTMLGIRKIRLGKIAVKE